MIPKDYPNRGSVMMPSDKHATTGKGPSTDEVKKGISPVDTPSFTHKQNIGPSGQGSKGLPDTGKTMP